jgi:hypothetical protein
MSDVKLNVNVQFVPYGSARAELIVQLAATETPSVERTHNRRPEPIVLPPLTIGDVIVSTPPARLLQY